MILTITMNPAIDKVYAVDDYAIGQVFRPKAMTATAGGKGLNVARVAHILGEEVIATGLIGGNTGKFIEEEVIKQGIQSCFVAIPGETRICINVMDEKNNISTEILEPGPQVSKEDCNVFLNKYKKLLDAADVVTASGSLPVGVCADFYNYLIQSAHKKNKKFLLDTSGKYLQEGVKEKPFLIKPNKDELQTLVDEELKDINDFARALIYLKNMGIELPVISLGSHGCISILDGGVYRFYAPSIKVLNTVGSGDAFVAGCAVALSRGMDKSEMIRMGMACGMANTQFFKTGMVSVELVNQFLKVIQVKRIL
ncbi:MAG: 1-phosphofructokinase [Firmicutes bacterium]|nr:1-phosphofructokinase [Bacillota bacterium]